MNICGSPQWLHMNCLLLYLFFKVEWACTKEEKCEGCTNFILVTAKMNIQVRNMGKFTRTKITLWPSHYSIEFAIHKLRNRSNFNQIFILNKELNLQTAISTSMSLIQSQCSKFPIFVWKLQKGFNTYFQKSVYGSIFDRKKLLVIHRIRNCLLHKIPISWNIFGNLI